MKIALIAFNFFPLKDGISHTLTDLHRIFQQKGENLVSFTPSFNNRSALGILDDNSYNLRHIAKELMNKQFNQLILNAFQTIIRSNIPWKNKLQILLILFAKPKLLMKTINNLRKLKPHFKKCDFDIIFGGTTSADTQLLAFLLSKLFDTKVVYLAHGNEFMIKGSLSLRNFLYKEANKIIVHSNKLKKILVRMRNVDSNKIEIIPPGIFPKDYDVKASKEQLRQKYDIPATSFVIMSVGRHVQRKNFSLLIKAVKNLIQMTERVDMKYISIGIGPETENLKQLVKNFNLQDKITFLGECPDTIRNEIYTLSDVFVMPSVPVRDSIEGFGVVFLEANLFKLPVIGTSSGGISEAIINGITGFTIEPDNLEELEQKLAYLYDNPKKREELGLNGHIRVLNEFTWEKLYNQYLNLFNQVFKSH